MRTKNNKGGAQTIEFLVESRKGVVENIHNCDAWHPKIIYKDGTTKWCEDNWKK